MYLGLLSKILLCIIGFLIVFGVEMERRERARRKLSQKRAEEEWLEAAVAFGDWKARHPFENREHPDYQRFLVKEITACAMYLATKNKATELEKRELRLLEAEVVNVKAWRPSSEE